MFIVEWYDEENNRCERTFDTKEEAEREAAVLKATYSHVAIIAEIEI